MRILITTGIYPPKIGGPAQYAKNLAEAFEKLGHEVSVKTYTMEDVLPTGIRHIFFFLKVIPSLVKSDVVFALDTFSVGLPAVFASKIFGKKCIIRTGGDFLWEQYVERTKKKVLLRNFYDTEKNNFTFKEKIIFWLTKKTLKNASHIIFSTDWQRNIFVKAYGLEINKTSIVENYYGPKESDYDYKSKIFIASARNLSWKNLDILKKIFEKVKNNIPEIELFTNNLPYDEFIQKMSKSYAVLLVSLGDISPNMIMDAIRLNRPFICTKEIGIYNRIKDIGIFIDPLNKEELEQKVSWLLDDKNYQEQKNKILNFNFTHTWEEIAGEFLEISNNLKQ